MEEEAIKLLAEIDKILQLGEKGLARVSEANEVEKKLKDFMQTHLDFDSELGREYEKWSKTGTWYQDVVSNGFANRSHLAPVQTLRSFLTRLLDTSDIKIPPTQQYVRTGEVFTGRRVLRDILSLAKTRIDIQDNYLDQEIFAILQPYFENNPNLSARLLTSDKFKPGFMTDFPLFLKQYGRVEAKTNNQAHIRTIILDGSDVYSTGSSIKDIGNKGDAILKIKGDEAKKAIEDFETWWSSGQEIVA